MVEFDNVRPIWAKRWCLAMWLHTAARALFCVSARNRWMLARLCQTAPDGIRRARTLFTCASWPPTHLSHHVRLALMSCHGAHADDSQFHKCGKASPKFAQFPPSLANVRPSWAQIGQFGCGAMFVTIGRLSSEFGQARPAQAHFGQIWASPNLASLSPILPSVGRWLVSGESGQKRPNSGESGRIRDKSCRIWPNPAQRGRKRANPCRMWSNLNESWLNSAKFGKAAVGTWAGPRHMGGTWDGRGRQMGGTRTAPDRNDFEAQRLSSYALDLAWVRRGVCSTRRLKEVWGRRPILQSGGRNLGRTQAQGPGVDETCCFWHGVLQRSRRLEVPCAGQAELGQTGS